MISNHHYGTAEVNNSSRWKTINQLISSLKVLEIWIIDASALVRTCERKWEQEELGMNVRLVFKG
jgi:hypothetical protein